MNEGWKCPVCGRGVAPIEKYCDHGGMGMLAPLLPFTQPADPNSYPNRIGGDCGCPLGKPCGSTACPRMPQITSEGSYAGVSIPVDKIQYRN